MSVVSEPGMIETLSPLLAAAKTRAVEIRDGDTVLGAIVSKDDYELVRKAKADKLLRAMAEFGESLRNDASEAGVSLDELEKMLDRKAP